MKLFSNDIILLLIGLFVIIFIFHLLLNFITYAFNDTLINRDLKTVKKHNKRIFKMKFKEINNYYDIRSLMHNYNRSHKTERENKYVVKYYKSYLQLKKRILDRQKVKHLPITSFYIWSVLSQVSYISFINGIIILQMNHVIQQENYNILVLFV
ncbi:hypothetical protein SAMN05216235_0084 [Salinicoccus halodurans]|uniref:Uncharacterized protein n=1 Tax=Salinicoccus halodurans TaxID=407035 RepID=A0A0F7D424_9STAP|nr:hypothetical protein AAT16_04235 [Salinicoccus halodurans]SFK51429.1 hypothetical protein SAMN05216235_0084 [Salinicoccus halodurans]